MRIFVRWVRRWQWASNVGGGVGEFWWGKGRLSLGSWLEIKWCVGERNWGVWMKTRATISERQYKKLCGVRWLEQKLWTLEVRSILEESSLSDPLSPPTFGNTGWAWSNAGPVNLYYIVTTTFFKYMYLKVVTLLNCILAFLCHFIYHSNSNVSLNIGQIFCSCASACCCAVSVAGSPALCWSGLPKVTVPLFPNWPWNFCYTV